MPGTYTRHASSTSIQNSSTKFLKNITSWQRVPQFQTRSVSRLSFINFPFLVTKPNPNHFVFVRFLVSKARHTILEHIDIEIKEDNIYFLPFEEVKGFCERGEAELV